MRKILFALALSSLASAVSAQSLFQGFYGQIATGYEGNNVSGLNATAVDSPCVENCTSSLSSSSKSFGGAPLVLGIGYNFSVAPKWLIGLGVDYSALSQSSSSFNYALTGAGAPAGTSVDGAKATVSNRMNVFLTGGYEVDKDKLVYLKAGYSAANLKSSSPSQFTVPGYGSVPVNTSFGSKTDTANGYLVGLGYKQLVSGGLYVYGEANYMGYSSVNTSLSGTDNNGVRTTINQKPSLNSYQILVGLGYKF